MTVTLDDLRAQFEGVVFAHCKRKPAKLATPDLFLQELKIIWREFKNTHLVEDDFIYPIYQAATRYIIARDFNVFPDDPRWEMVWKLTYGGAV